MFALCAPYTSAIGVPRAGPTAFRGAEAHLRMTFKALDDTFVTEQRVFASNFVIVPHFGRLAVRVRGDPCVQGADRDAIRGIPLSWHGHEDVHV